MENGDSELFEVEITPDQMEVWVKGAALAEWAEAIAEALKKYGVKPLPSVEELRRVFAGGAGHVCVLRGQAATEAVDSEMRWTHDFFGAGFRMDEATGKLDYRARTAEASVEPEQLLGVLTPAVDGVPGLDVLGRRLPARKGAQIKLRAGEGVRVEASTEGEKFFATTAGRVREAQGAVTVDAVYKVTGDVDLAQGNIVHNGSVEISGDVNPGFRVEATGDITIGGAVDNAEIVCGGNLEVRAGVSGARGDGVHVQGWLKALYLSDAHVDVAGDVFITNEIIHSRVAARGKILMKTGKVVGGETYALHGMELHDAGCEHATHTLLVVGRDPQLDAALAAKVAEGHQLAENVERMKQGLATARRNESRMTPEQKQALTNFQVKLGEMEMAVSENGREAEAIREQARELCKAQILVEMVVYPETDIRMGDPHGGELKRMVAEAVKGPLVCMVGGRDIILKPVTAPPAK